MPDNQDPDITPVQLNPADLISASKPRPSRRQVRATRGNRPDLSIVSPTAADILSGSDSELRTLARRVGQAERAASRQTERARELLRRVNSNDPSLNLRAENERLRARITDYRVIVGAYANGDRELADELTQIADPKTRRFASLMTRDSQRLIQGFTERAEQRRQYVYDSHGHRVRRDMLDSHNECPECKRENRRLAEQTAGQSG
jgi:YD repeat-containing protein